MLKISERPPTHESAQSNSPFLTDMLAGLSASPKHISPKYFYDAHGSALFDQICELPEYYPTRTELGILQTHAADMAKHMGEHADVIEFGAGSLQKIRWLLNASTSPTRYVPLDISGDHLQTACLRLQTEFPYLQIQPQVCDYTAKWQLPPAIAGAAKRVIFFPGSTLGNFSPAQARHFFSQCASHLPGGALLLGVDLIKSPQLLHAAYNDAQGVTAAFNLNLLTRANQELGANFNLAQFAHSAFYNAPMQRIEMHLQSLCEQQVQIAGQRFAFSQGETLHTEYSYKFTIAGVQQTAAQAGLHAGPVWTDPQHMFGLLWLDIPPTQETSR